MKITAKTKGIKKEDWRYFWEGDLISDEEIIIDLDMGLFVSGGIEAGKWIEAGEWIKAGGGIEAGLSITCKGVLKFSYRLFAGTASWLDISVDDENVTITCGKLEGGKVCYGTVVETGLPERVEAKLITLSNGKKVSEETIVEALKGLVKS